MVKKCDESIIDDLGTEQIKDKIFGKFQIGRAIKWEREVYLEFLDSNEVETLETHFHGFGIKDLGEDAQIDEVDENFDFDSVSELVRRMENEKS